MSYELKDGDVAIIVSPETDKDGSWTGILKTGLVFGEEQHPSYESSYGLCTDYGSSI